jgi:hypothetical protein
LDCVPGGLRRISVIRVRSKIDQLIEAGLAQQGGSFSGLCGSRDDDNLKSDSAQLQKKVSCAVRRPQIVELGRQEQGAMFLAKRIDVDCVGSRTEQIGEKFVATFADEWTHGFVRRLVTVAREHLDPGSRMRVVAVDESAVNVDEDGAERTGHT